MLKWIRCLRRGHQPLFIRNIYGDEIISYGWNTRSIWRCGHCGRVLYRPDLHSA